MTIEELAELVERKKEVTVINKGVTPLALLGIAFIVLKVMGYITWSWWWVLAPFWIPVCIGIITLVALMVIVGIFASKTVQVEIPQKEEPKEEPKVKEEAKTEEKKPKKTSKQKANGKENIKGSDK